MTVLKLVPKPKLSEFDRLYAWADSLPQHGDRWGQLGWDDPMTVREIARATGIRQVALPPLLLRQGWYPTRRLPGGIWLWHSPFEALTPEELERHG
ncbi:hypothetical protein MNR01_05975 [Lysobacter sp. S4-A87]|uniref:hypothetical protein n=1 Tax=Lysobacter sp. S4-A87 TaxID=2925843 RepID=UPI001F53671B|nr:hypothetical protein [Lysobacter sp. S4-A87]UNK50552.1 hypothetical protein MNR01_05975 [Lysobacter sp. S4-A87]